MFDIVFLKFSIFVIAITWIFLYFRYKYQYFARRGIPTPKVFPIVGNFQEMFRQRKTMVEMFSEMYQQFPDRRVYGVYQFTQPAYFIRDPELVKQICIKNCENFVNHRGNFGETIDPLIGSNLFAMRDQRWKTMRATMSPVFTGSKIRKMFALMDEAMRDIVDYLLGEASKSENGLETELQDLTKKCNIDLIATAVFGLEINSVKNPDNEFYRNALYFEFGDGQTLKYFLFNAIPKIMKLLGIKMIDPKISVWIFDIVQNTIETRRRENIYRNDVIQLIMEVMDEQEASSEKTWTDRELIGQCAVFFMAGLETTAIQLSFIIYELAINSDVQSRLVDEIDRMVEETKGKFDYETVNGLKYLDNVVSEGTRKWPSLMAIDRECNATTVFEEHDGTKVELQPGDGLQVPVYAIQHDPKYYPDPDKFDPERFNENNALKSNLLTFGVGPRSCIGQRFALTEIKVFLVRMMSAFTFEAYEKTENPLTFKKGSFLLKSETGIWIRLKPRGKTMEKSG